MKVFLCIFMFLFLSAFIAIAEEPGTKILIPVTDSEVLDEVSITILPDSAGKIEHFGIKVQEGESGGYEIFTDPESGKYKAIKKEIPEEIKDDIENQLMLNAVSPSSAITRGVVGYLQTEEPIDWKLCSTFSSLLWTPQLLTGSSTMWTWDADPSQIGTHWYTKRDRNYKVETDDLYAYSHAWAMHQNKDFGLSKLKTNVYHDVYVQGYFYAEPPSTATVYVNGHASYIGEGWNLLHSHLYYYWGSQPIY